MIPILLYHILYLLSTRSFSWAAQNIKKDRVVTLSPGSICTCLAVPSEQFFGLKVAHTYAVQDSNLVSLDLGRSPVELLRLTMVSYY